MPAPAPEVLPQAVATEAPEPEPAPVPVAEKRPRRPKAEPRADARPRSSWSLFSLLDRVTSVDGLFREGLPVRYLPHLLFVMLLTLLYIGNTHYGNRMNRNIQRLKQETEDLRADYTTLKSDYMEASKQSEVARKVAAFGLVESSSPPFRISVPAGRLDAAELELMPVLTADTLSARAARDSAAAQQKASLSGRKRPGTAGADDNDTVEPEIIAPPQGIDSASVGGVAPAVRQLDKPNNRMKVQKSTSQSKAKSANRQAVRTDNR
ncbi:hypothetical protein BEN48_09255 [Hymenobacter glacialis]|uniref:Cell division protein FtsL n=2 Tax=Hymenobacter glacialis TaxID=1908236 RepID=A0A1G1TCI4_9BACT|nr:hypothetical protein BEN48_09255 [Hymenobacter glacialis]